jgi:hypothetical protein
VGGFKTVVVTEMRGIVDRWKLPGMWSSTHLGIARRVRLVALLGLFAFMVVAAPAGATGPTYPGETLTVTQSAPAVVGLETGFVATGQQADIDDDPLGFDFAALVKDASVDPACSPSFTEKEADAVSDPTEQWVTAPTLFQGTDPTFSLSFKVNFARPGTFLVCAYSEYLDDTAAAASVTVTVTGGTTPTPTPIPPKPTPKPTPKPANTKRPTITRSGERLTCRRGVWSGAPTRYAYAWFVSGRAKTGAHARTLRISRVLRGHRLQCGVTASNANGTTTARSGSYRMR